MAGSTVRLKNYHTFGCPVYVLDARVQDAGGAEPPKWDPRSYLGIYVGRLSAHAASVAPVLNPKTGLVPPQFHVVLDDDFSTVPSLRNGSVSDTWHQLVCNSREKSTDGFYDVTKTWLTAEHGIFVGDTTKAAESVGQRIDAGLAITHQVVEPIDAQVDRAAPFMLRGPLKPVEANRLTILRILENLLILTQMRFQHLTQACRQY